MLRLCLVLLAVVAGASAWGNTGHQVVATIAQNLLTKRASDAVAKILNGQTMELVSTWADDVKHTAAYEWSAPLHYVDAADKMCTFDYSRDCWNHESTQEASPDFCVVGAIANYTKRAQEGIALLRRMEENLHERHAQRVSGNKLRDSTTASVQEAVKFLIHFIGDVHQPLHVGFTTDRGGNEIMIKFFGTSVNLHAIWDYNIIDHILGDYYSGSQSAWATALTNEILNGNFTDDAKNWAQCADGSVDCTSTYASESVAFACSAAYECEATSNAPCDSQRVVEGSVLAEPYQLTSYWVVNQRIAQGGVRLAALMNNLFG